MPISTKNLSKQPIEIYEIELQVIEFLEKHRGKAFTSKEIFDHLKPEVKLLKPLFFMDFCATLTLMMQKGLVGMGYYGKDAYIYIE